MAAPQGPSAGDISSQAAAFEKLNAVLERVAAGFDKVGSSASTQATAYEAAQAQLMSAAEGANRANEKFREDMKKNIESIESWGDAANVMKSILKNMGGEGKKAAAALAGVSGALKGMASGFKLSFNLAKSFISGVQSIIGAVFDLTAAILSIPFKLWESLIGMAKGGGGGGGGLLEAINKVREVFGDIKKGTAAEVIDIARGLASWGDMAPGLMKVSRQFGTLKDAIEYVMKLAGPAPVLFSSLKDEFEKTGKNVFIMAKGLGIGEEEFAGLMNAAKSFGQSVESIEVEMTKFAKGLSSEFGLNSKLMSRDMARAMKDVKHFANSSVKEIAKATAYAHSLGLELKDITGILDAFNTFDQAAENVSKLSQAFGVNIDVMKLVEAKTPDDALKMLKDSFTSAGKSVENMNRQELQLIASTVGMSEEAVRQGLSTKNQAISMNRLAASTDHLAKKTMTASEATTALKNDIEHVIQGGGGGGPESNSLMGMFFEGFKEGITTTSSFRQIIRNLRMDIQIVMEQGRQLGRAFVETFPGVKKFFEGLADILSPDKIGGLFRSYKETFIKFFKDMSEGKGTVKDLMESLKKNFMDYLTKSGPGGQKVLEGLREFWNAFRLVIASAIDYVGDTMRDGLNMLIDLISGKYTSGINSAMGKIGEEISPIKTAFAGMFEKIKGPLSELFGKFWSWATSKLGEIFKEHWGKIMLYMIGPSLVAGLGTGLMSYVSSRLVQGPIVGQLKKMTGLMQQQAMAGASPAGGLPGAVPAPPPGMATPGQGLSGWKQGLSAFGTNFGAEMGTQVVSVASMFVKAQILIKAMGDLVDLIKEKNLTEKQFDQVMKIMEAAMSFFTRSQAIGGLSSALGSAASRIGTASEGAEKAGGISQAGAFGAMAGTIIGMLAAAGAVILAAKHINEGDIGKIEAITKILPPIGDMFLKAILVVAGGIGLAALSSIPAIGQIGAAMAAAGVAGLTAVVGIMVGVAVTAMESASQLPGDPSAIRDKTEALAVVMDAVSKMMIASAEILKEMPMNMFSGADKIKTTFEEAGKFFKDLLGPDAGVVKVINTLKDFSSTIKPEQIEGVKAVASVISAIGSMFSALGPALQSLTERVEKNRERLFGAVKFKGITTSMKHENMVQLNQFIVNIGQVGSGIFTSIKDSLKAFTPAEAAAAGPLATSMGGVLTATTGLLNALLSSLKDFRTKTETVDEGIINDDKSIIEKFDTKAFGDFIDLLVKKLPDIQKPLTDLFKGVAQEALNFANSFDPKKLEGMKALAEIMNTASAFVGVVMSALKANVSIGGVTLKGVETQGARGMATEVTNVEAISQSVTNTVTVNLPNVVEILKAISENVPTLLGGVIEQLDKLKNVPSADIINKAKAVKTVIKSISAVFEMMKGIFGESLFESHKGGRLQAEMEKAKPGSGASGKQLILAGFKESVNYLVQMIESLSSVAEGDKESPLKKIESAISKAPKFDATIISKLDGVTKVFDSFGKINDALSKVVSGLANLGFSKESAAENKANQASLGIALRNAADTTLTEEQRTEALNASEELQAKIKDFGIGKIIEPMTTVLNQLSAPDSGLDQLTAAAKKVPTILGQDKLAALSTASMSINTFFGSTGRIVDAIDTGLSKGTDKGIADMGTRIKAHIEKMNTALKEFDAGLAAASTGGIEPINIKLGSIANGLGVKDAQVAVARGPINFQFKINVQVSGKEMSEAVSAPGTVIFQAFQTAGTSGGNWDTGSNPLSVKPRDK